MAVFELRTFRDIYTAVAEELKISQADTVSINRIKRDINIVYRETIAYKRWWWMVEQAKVTIPEFFTLGTCQVVHGSSLVVFSENLYAPREGHYFSLEGDNEMYLIESHTPGSNELRLANVFNGPTNLATNYKIWNDKIPLPTNCKETVEILSPFTRMPLENLGFQEYKRLISGMPKREGTPEAYYTGDFTEPFPDSAIGSMPSLRDHKSDGVVKTLVFNGALPASIVANTMLRIRAANHPGYNGEINVAQVTTTSVANDTLIYTGPIEHSEPFTPDSGMSIRLIQTTANRSRYRAISFYPYLTRSKLTLSLDYIKNAPPLENDSDEPLIPLDDRIVLLYGAKGGSWARERNPEEATKNLTLYQNHLARMAGQIQDSLDKPLLRPSRLYLSAKRSSFRSRRFHWGMDGFAGAGAGSPGGQAVATLGTPNTVAIFNASGELEGSSVISVAELNYLDGASANIQAAINTINATISSAFVTNALVNASANIDYSKLASLSNNIVPVSNGSGKLTSSTVTATELSFLAGVTPLTTVALNDNQAAAADAILIPAANTFCFIVYSIKRATTYEGGVMVLLNDGASASLTIDNGDLNGLNGVALTADVSGGNVRVRYTSTLTGAAPSLKYSVIKWAA